MNKIDMTSALMEMQKMSAQSSLKPIEQLNQLPEDSPENFAQLLKVAVDSVSEAQKESGRLKKAFELGDPNVDLPQVMVASQKAGVAFEAMLEVRSKLMQAYKDVMSMSV